MIEEPTFTTGLHYRDPKAALAWLEHAFGFEVTMAIDGPAEAPEMCHYEMAHEGRGRIMIGAEWADFARSPAGPGGGRDHPGRARRPVLRRPYLPGERSRGPRVDVLGARPRCQPGRGRGGA